MLLLVGLVDDRAIQLVKEETDKGSSLFHSLEKWNPQMQIGNRLVWALCQGITPPTWDVEYIKQIMLTAREVVTVDDDVDEFQRMDRVRVLIKASWQPLIQHAISASINEEEH